MLRWSANAEKRQRVSSFYKKSVGIGLSDIFVENNYRIYSLQSKNFVWLYTSSTWIPRLVYLLS